MASKTKFKFRNQSGTTMIEMAVALPLFFSMLFIFQDVFVVSYNWVLMQNIVHEGVREGILGPYDKVANSHLRRAETKMADLASGLGIINNEDFQIKNSELYKSPDEFYIRACGLRKESNLWGFGSDRESTFGELIIVTVKKKIRLTPVSEMLISLANKDGTIQISAESQGFVEPSASSASLTDYCICGTGRNVLGAECY